MNNFCECRNIYILKKNTQGTYEHYCIICDKFIPIDGPVLYEVNNIRKNEKKNTNKINAAVYDETYATAKKSCPECNNPELRYFLDDTLKRIYVCSECGSYW